MAERKTVNSDLAALCLCPHCMAPITIMMSKFKRISGLRYLPTIPTKCKICGKGFDVNKPNGC